jgi:ABC-type polysaccharide/polyol phosphate export permease
MIRSLNEISEILRYKELLRNLVSRDIKVRYKRSVLGFLWVMLHPLLMMIVLSMVFSEIFKITTKNYSVYVLSGFILWNFFFQSTSSALGSFTGNRQLINKVYLPKSIFPLSVICSGLIHFIFSLVPLFIIFFVSGTPLSPRIIILPIIIIMVMVFSFGISLIIATLTVFFHDTRYIYDVLLTALMYATPIFYPESIVPQKYVLILHLNPLFYFMDIFRMALYLDGPHLFGSLLYGGLFSFAAFVIGWFFYNRYKERIIYYL